MKKGFRLYFEEEDYERWQKFCEHYFKSKKVLSKIVTESMEEYIVNFENKKN